VRPADVLEFVRRRPFQPFRITLTDGRTYDARHPDLIMVGRSSMVLGTPAPEETEPVYDRAIPISLLHIMQIEALPAPAEPTAN
jgi:hypothetical protein